MNLNEFPYHKINRKYILISICLLFITFYSANIFAGISPQNKNNYNTYNPFLGKSANTLTTTITASATNVCKGSTAPKVTFSITSGGSSPYTFYYTKNGVSDKILTNSKSSSISISTTTATTINVTLDSVSSGNSAAEKQVDKKIAITINELPTVNFTFNNNECAGADIMFNPVVDSLDNYTYLWDFGDTSTSTMQSPVHNFFPWGTGTQNFTVKLTVTNKHTGCSNTKTAVVTIKKGGDTSMSSTAELKDYNGFKTFLICENTRREFEFNNRSETKPTNTSYSIDWGDGSEIFSDTAWTSLKHSYNPGLWNLKYTVFTEGSCSVTQTYNVFVGSNPSVSLGNPGNTDVCSGNDLKFPITNTVNNPPGTTYTITFNDGSDPIVYQHPPPTEVTHTFTKSSCGFSSQSYSNSFSATIVARNPCNESKVSVEPIYVTAPPKGGVKGSNSIACVNEMVNFYNPNELATMAGPNGCIGSKIVWSITPKNYNLNGYSLGDDFGSDNYNVWQSGSPVIYPTFTAAGTYYVRIRVGNKCNIDEATDTICVTAPPVPTFTLDKTEGCFPLTVNTNNTTDETNNCGNPIAYKWEIVSYASGNCGTSSSYSMTNGTNTQYNSSSPSKNTKIILKNPGTYTLRLSATNNCGTFYSSNQQNITVKAPPIVSINSITTVCQTFPVTKIQPTAAVTNCGSDALNYEWSFTGGNPSTSSSSVPGNIEYSNSGTYTISLKVTNECGVSTTATKTVTINPTPVLTSAISNQLKCAN